jgi:predicted CoA-binding protein/GNAT superfamily N-acetyltransferase
LARLKLEPIGTGDIIVFFDGVNDVVLSIFYNHPDGTIIDESRKQLEGLGSLQRLIFKIHRKFAPYSAFIAVLLNPIKPAQTAKEIEAKVLRETDNRFYWLEFAGVPERFTTVDMVDRVALVAVLGDELIADARYDRWAGKDEAEVAFTVADEHQGRGLSTILLEHLAAIARSHGIARFTAEVLGENRAMLSVFARAGWPVSRAFDSGVVDVVFDIVPTPDYLNTVDRREQRAESRSIARLLNPRTVAVVGASDDPSSIGRVLMQNLLSGGFAGPVYPVNPAHERVANMRCFPSLDDVPDDVALAIVAVPPEHLEAVLDDAIAKHVRGLLIVTGDLPAGTDGETPLVRRLVTRARGNGIRIIGPASMGVLTTGQDSALRAVLAPTPSAYSDQRPPS